MQHCYTVFTECPSTSCSLRPCSKVVFAASHTNRQSQSLFLLFVQSILFALCAVSVPSICLVFLSSLSFSLYLLFLLSVTLCHSRFVSLLVSVSVPDSSSRGVCLWERQTDCVNCQRHTSIIHADEILGGSV